jgi:hypothetical protein
MHDIKDGRFTHEQNMPGYDSTCGWCVIAIAFTRWAPKEGFRKVRYEGKTANGGN